MLLSKPFYEEKNCQLTSCFKYNVGINIKVIFIPENVGRKADKSEVIFR